jgi:P-type Ca2+ transporter type 2C
MNEERSMQKGKSVYTDTIDEIETRFSTDKNTGLTSDSAKKRLDQYGENRLEKESQISVWKILFRQFKSVVMLLLIAAAAASFFIGENVEGFAVLIVILLTAILGLIMEYKAGKSIEALQKNVHEEAKVIREGEVFNIPTTELVLGDLIVIEEGDQIPADGRVIESEELARPFNS